MPNHNQRWINANREHFRAWTRQRGRTRKLRLLAMFGYKCVDCGYATHPAALDFDHTDPTTKKFDISKRMHSRWSTLVEEAAKCVIRCANCHRIKTMEAGESGPRK